MYGSGFGPQPMGMGVGMVPMMVGGGGMGGGQMPNLSFLDRMALKALRLVNLLSGLCGCLSILILPMIAGSLIALAYLLKDNDDKLKALGVPDTDGSTFIQPQIFVILFSTIMSLLFINSFTLTDKRKKD
ncbi:hypothetical protein SNEBB_006269 [Seison nebaliae]|nr:hypothetical protein SNEBB_006269 [Seison nebaliae]